MTDSAVTPPRTRRSRSRKADPVAPPPTAPTRSSAGDTQAPPRKRRTRKPPAEPAPEPQFEAHAEAPESTLDPLLPGSNVDPAAEHGGATEPEAGTAPGSTRGEEPEARSSPPTLDAGTDTALSEARLEHGDHGRPDDETDTPVIPLRARHGSAPPAPTARESARPGQQRPGGFKQRALQAARDKFAGDPRRSPLDKRQIDTLLGLLHEPGRRGTLVSSTWTYLRNGMSSAHAAVAIDKLRGTFGDRRRAA